MFTPRKPALLKNRLITLIKGEKDPTLFNILQSVVGVDDEFKNIAAATVYDIDRLIDKIKRMDPEQIERVLDEIEAYM